MRGRRRANRRSQRGLDDLFHIIRANGLVHLRRHRFVQPEQQRCVQRQDQPLIRRHIGALFQRLCLNGKFLHRLQGIHQVYPFRQRFSGHPPEQRQHAHISRRNRRRARHQQDDHQHQNRELQYSLSGATQVNPRQSFTAQFKPCCSWHFPPPSCISSAQTSSCTNLNPYYAGSVLSISLPVRARRLFRLGLSTTSHQSRFTRHYSPATLPQYLVPFSIDTTGHSRQNPRHHVCPP